MMGSRSLTQTTIILIWLFGLSYILNVVQSWNVRLAVVVHHRFPTISEGPGRIHPTFQIYRNRRYKQSLGWFPYPTTIRLSSSEEDYEMENLDDIYDDMEAIEEEDEFIVEEEHFDDNDIDTLAGVDSSGSNHNANNNNNNDQTQDVSFTPELSMSEIVQNKVPPRRRARTHLLPSPSLGQRRKGKSRGEEKDDDEDIPGGGSRSSSSSSSSTTTSAMNDTTTSSKRIDNGTLMEGSKRLDDLAKTMDDIILHSKDEFDDEDNDDDEQRYREGDSTTEDSFQTDDTNRMEGEYDYEAEWDLQNEPDGVSQDYDVDVSMPILSEDEETMELLRKLRDKKQYEQAAMILESLQEEHRKKTQQQQPQRRPPISSREDMMMPQYQNESNDIAATPNVKKAFDERSNMIAEFEQQLARNTQLPSLEDENVEIAELLQRAREEGNLRRGENSNPYNTTTVTGTTPTAASSAESEELNQRFITDYEPSSDGTIFLSEEAYRQASQGNTVVNSDGSLNFASRSSSTSSSSSPTPSNGNMDLSGSANNNNNNMIQRQQSRRPVKVSQSALDSIMEGPMAPYKKAGHVSNPSNDTMASRQGYDDGNDDITLEELMETYRNLNRSLIESVTGWKDVNHLDTSATTPTPEQEEQFHRLLDEGDEIEDRAYKEWLTTDPSTLYQKHYADEINELDNMLERVRERFGLNDDDTTESNNDNNDGDDGKDENSSDGGRGIFFASTPEGMELNKMFESDTIAYKEAIDRYYDESKDDDDWGFNNEIDES